MQHLVHHRSLQGRFNALHFVDSLLLFAGALLLYQAIAPLAR